MSTSDASSSLPSDSEYALKYCSLCDMYFYSAYMLKAHIRSSSRHPECKDCNMRFLNKNSRRNHYTVSERHNFCRECDTDFKTAGGLDIHFDHAHGYSDDEDDDPSRPPGWEDRLALELEDKARNVPEIPIPKEDLSPVRPVAKVKKLRKNRAVHRFNCPICLSAPKKMTATRCGHVFCNACIKHALDQTKTCPNCRQEALISQLRRLDLSVYSNEQ